MRLQVFLSHSGVCSRRNALNIIKDGLIKVNGKVISEPSFFVDAKNDHVKYQNKLIVLKKHEYIVLNKPQDFITSKNDKFAKQTIFDLIPKQYKHLLPVGRLDKDTEGLLLLTNDGDIAYKLSHPKFNIDKSYHVTVKGRMTNEEKAKLEKGVYIDGKRTSSAKIASLRCKKDQTQFSITIHEGKKRQIRRMCAKVGHKVLYLKRFIQGPIKLGKLALGQVRLLTKQEIEALRNL